MSWIKKNPLFFALLTGLSLVLIIQLVLLFQFRGNAQQARENLDSQIAQRDRLFNQRPTPVPTNVEAMDQDQMRHEARLREFRDLVQGFGDVEALFAGVPDTNANAFFEISRWRVATEQRFRSARMLTGDQPNLGFNEYRSQVPLNAPLDIIHQQRRVVSFLLDQLYETRPQRLVRVQRDDPEVLIRPATEETADRRGATTTRRPEFAPSRSGFGTETQGDYFVISPHLTVRTPGMIETLAFRVVFDGQTSNLRNFLQRIQEMEYPLFVRNIRVEPLEVERGRRDLQDDSDIVDFLRRDSEDSEIPEGGGQVDFDRLTPEQKEILRPIIGNVANRFTVTLEFVRLTESAALAEHGMEN